MPRNVEALARRVQQDDGTVKWVAGKEIHAGQLAYADLFGQRNLACRDHGLSEHAKPKTKSGLQLPPVTPIKKSSDRISQKQREQIWDKSVKKMVQDSKVNERRAKLGIAPLKVTAYGGGELAFDVAPVYTQKQKAIIAKIKAVKARNYANHLKEERDVGLVGIGQLYRMPSFYRKGAGRSSATQKFAVAAAAARRAVIARKLGPAHEFVRASMAAARDMVGANAKKSGNPGTPSVTLDPRELQTGRDPIASRIPPGRFRSQYFVD